jgi:hypothetical protein
MTQSVVSLKHRKAAIFTSCVTSSDRVFERHDGSALSIKLHHSSRRISAQKRKLLFFLLLF